MQIDYDSYNNMSVDELEKIISHTKNILHLRDNEIKKAFKKKDLKALEKALEKNPSKKIGDKIWSALNFENIQAKDWDFFKFCTKLPKYKDFDHPQSTGTRFTRTESAVFRSFYDEKLFDLFINESKYKQIMEKMIENKIVVESPPYEIIPKLFEHNLLQVSKELLMQSINKKDESFVFYLLNQNIDLSEDDYSEIYSKGCLYFNEHTLNIITERFPKYKNLSVDHIISSIPIAFFRDENDKTYTQHKIFVKANDSVYKKVLQEHDFDEKNIRKILSALNNLSPNQDNKFIELVKIIVEKKPEYIDVLKDLKPKIMSNPGQLRKIYEKIVDHADLEINLTKNEITSKSRLKL